MPIPNRLEDWSYGIVKELCDLGQVETDRFDFKAGLPPSGTVTKIGCAFANSKGGFVVLGVEERSRRHVAQGISRNAEIARDFGHKLKANPSIAFEPPLALPIPNSNLLIYVFHVPVSPERPHYDPLASKFWKRTNTGCEQMTLEEIRAQFMNYEERRVGVKLLVIELLFNRQMLEGYQVVADGQYPLATLDSSMLDRLTVDIYSMISEDADVVRTLFTLRANIQMINNRAHIFFSQMALSYTEGAKLQMARDHSAFLKSKAQFLVPMIDKALTIIEARFGIRDPLPVQAASPASS